MREIAQEAAGVGFVAESGGNPGVRLRRKAAGATDENGPDADDSSSEPLDRSVKG